MQYIGDLKNGFLDSNRGAKMSRRSRGMSWFVNSESKTAFWVFSMFCRVVALDLLYNLAGSAFTTVSMGFDETLNFLAPGANK